MSVIVEEAKIIFFEPINLNHKKAFSCLNREWIEKDFEMEDIDEKVLGFPEEYILDKGGYIFLAEINDEIVGTAALIKEENDEYELSKFTVKESYRGCGIGARLIQGIIDFSQKLNAKRIHLITSKKLNAAINLYLKFGFVTDQTCLKCSKCGKDAISMELKLQD